MKKILNVIILICVAQKLFSQNLSLNELFTLCNKSDWDIVNEYMLKKGWDYHQSSKGDDEHYNTITWSYNKDSYSDKAQGWFYLYTYEGMPNKISYSFFNKPSYNTIKTGITSAGMKLIDNSIEDNEIIVKYSNSNFIVTLKTAKREKEESYYSDNSITAYNVIVIKKSGIYDKDNGLKKTYDVYGNLESEYTLKEGVINGIGKAFYQNGQVKVVSTFVNGKKQGSSKEFNEYGTLTAEYNYLNGELNGVTKIYNSEGKIRKEYSMKSGILDGLYNEYYYDQGNLFVKVTGSYSDDKKTGLWQTIKFKDKTTELLDFKNYNNDVINGNFKEIKNDSIIFGSYSNGVLNGSYKIYKNLTTFLFGGINGDTTNCPLITNGNYINGLKEGSWKFYSWTRDLIKEGKYYNDREVGEWKYYFDNYTDDKGKKLPYSGKLYLIENYENGLKNGKEIRYAFLEKIEVPCDTVGNTNLNPLDTCHQMQYIKVNQTAFYKNNNLHGPCEGTDSLGVLEFKGNFIQGKKDGLWVQQKYILDFLYHEKGYYVNGNKNGKWITYYKEGKNIEEENYENGIIDGKCIEYFSNNVYEAFYEKGSLKKIMVYDSTKNNIMWSYEFLSETSDDFKCIYTYYGSNKKIQKGYNVKKYSSNPLSHVFFDAYYGLKFIGDSEESYTDGILKVYDDKNRLSVEGYQYKGVKNGEWKFYYYESNVYSVVQYKGEGQVYSEKYYKLNTNELFTGKFIDKYANGQKMVEIKISDGLRNGKSKYFDEKGELTSTENYDKGILKKD